MKDFNDQEIQVGDEVIFYKVGYKRLMRGRVYNIGEKMVCVEYSTSPMSNIGKYKVYPLLCILDKKNN